MAYQMVHLEIAYRLLDKFKWIEKPADFMLASLAPDSVHFHPEYDVSLKEASHIWNCGPKWGITIESDKWKANAISFWELHKNDENRDFMAGYCAHILTDWLNDLRIWAPFREKIIKGADREELYKIYSKEAIGSDIWLHQQSRNCKEIMKLLSEGRAYSIKGCVWKADIEAQREYIINEQYKDKEIIDISGYSYCSREIIESFIDECIELLSEILYL